MIEQRKHQRFELRLPFEVVRNGSPMIVRGETKNVSSAGVLFTAEGERGFPGAAQARDHGEGVARDLDVDIFEIVLACAVHGDAF